MCLIRYRLDVPGKGDALGEVHPLRGKGAGKRVGGAGQEKSSERETRGQQNLGCK